MQHFRWSHNSLHLPPDHDEVPWNTSPQVDTQYTCSTEQPQFIPLENMTQTEFLTIDELKWPASSFKETATISRVTCAVIPLILHPLLQCHLLPIWISQRTWRNWCVLGLNFHSPSQPVHGFFFTQKVLITLHTHTDPLATSTPSPAALSFISSAQIT